MYFYRDIMAHLLFSLVDWIWLALLASLHQAVPSGFIPLCTFFIPINTFLYLRINLFSLSFCYFFKIYMLIAISHSAQVECIIFSENNLYDIPLENLYLSHNYYTGSTSTLVSRSASLALLHHKISAQHCKNIKQNVSEIFSNSLSLIFPLQFQYSYVL